MKFSILHTSARPDKWKGIYDAWRFAAHDVGSIDYVLVCDKRWGFDHLPTPDDGFYGTAVWNTGRKCYVDGVNIAAAYATGDVLIVNADDQYPCAHWDKRLRICLDTHPEKDNNFVLEVNTDTPAEHERGILVMPILSRARYEKLGYVLYPAYESMYSDNDFCEMAKRDQCIIDARHLTFPHRHPIFHQEVEWDVAYKTQNRPQAYELGRAVLEKRRESNFGDVRVVINERPEKPSILLLLPGEMFSEAWVSAIIKILSAIMPHFEVNIQTGFSSNVYVTRCQLLDTAKSWPKRPDYILWIDDDQIMTVEGLQHLITDLEQSPELAGVAGWAWCEGNIYGHEPMLSCGIYDREGKSLRLEYELMQSYSSDLIPISYSGFPAVLMRGSILDQMSGRDFFPIFDDELFKPWGMSGEDAAFFFRANEKGLKFAVDRRVKVPHLKLRCAEPVLGASLDAPVPVERTN